MTAAPEMAAEADAGRADARTTVGPAADPTSDLAPVAFAGEPGAFAEDAVLAFLGDVPRTPVAGFREVFETVAAGRAASGIVPIENLVNGTVRENYDLLLEHELEIVGEVVVPVRLCLAALPGQRLDDIERVYSHIQALGQAEAFLRLRPWTLLTTYNTAGSGKLIADRRERGSAAVLSPRAAEVFGLEVLAHDIQSVPDNRTRFLVLARSDHRPPDRIGPAGSRQRTTLVFAVRNEPGTLLAVLAEFASRSINLSTLESRPSRERAWEYVFWADLDGHPGDPALADALVALQPRTTMLRVLGGYPAAQDG
jgi:prephenate dehydratase